MKLELDHFFVLVEPGAACRDMIKAEGFEEGVGRRHPGQGTSNCTFPFANGFMELLWVHDPREAQAGPGAGLGLAQRAADAAASPFGVILRPAHKYDDGVPFEGWTYQPDYFEPPTAFHVGENSACLDEPLCIYAPFLGGSAPATKETSSITELLVFTASSDEFGILDTVNGAERLSIAPSGEHRIELTLDGNRSGKRRDFRPHLPLIMRW